MLEQTTPTTLNTTWQQALGEEKKKTYFKTLIQFIQTQKNQGKIIYPPTNDIFNAFKLTPLQNVKVVILGQDPYHGEGQAHGLSFSVPNNTPIPPSLNNIYKAIRHDLQCDFSPKHGNLTAWAEAGVLLLNTVLTVNAGQPQSHQSLGWQSFTDTVFRVLASQQRPMVYLLWGSSARKKASLIQHPQHLVCQAPHPSPLSAHRGFLTCKHFSLCNDWLERHGQAPIPWTKISD